MASIRSIKSLLTLYLAYKECALNNICLPLQLTYSIYQYNVDRLSRHAFRITSPQTRASN